MAPCQRTSGRLRQVRQPCRRDRRRGDGDEDLRAREWRGCMFACLGRRSPLRRLQGAHEATMFSQLEVPPLERGITWSTVRFECEPQYWQGQAALANTARPGVLARGAS